VRVGILRFIELMHAKLANTADVASWLEIVREVEPLFGPMPDFKTMLLRKIDERAALCVRSRDPVVVLGGILLGGSAPYGWIRWLAVRSSARGIGIGQCLVEGAVKRLPTSNAISVDTFREENMQGRPARRLYERLGFLPGPLVEIEGLPRQRYTLYPLHKS
jgi:ribosomal protein S18 acetylase RimI-like enzyme